MTVFFVYKFSYCNSGLLAYDTPLLCYRYATTTDVMILYHIITTVFAVITTLKVYCHHHIIIDSSSFFLLSFIIFLVILHNTTIISILSFRQHQHISSRAVPTWARNHSVDICAAILQTVKLFFNLQVLVGITVQNKEEKIWYHGDPLKKEERSSTKA